MRDCSKKTMLSATTIISSIVSFACLCISVSTDHWLNTEEKYAGEASLPPANQTVRSWSTGLWRKCFEERPHPMPKKNCSYINYFKQMDKEGLIPTESIILSLRRSTVFPLISLVILLAGEIVTLLSHYDRRKKVLTFVSGILFVIAGLFTLIGIILYIGAITEEAGSKKSSADGIIFQYWYGASFVLTVTSFTTAELTGVLSVYLYISRHKHAYRKKVKRLTNSGNGNGNGGGGIGVSGGGAPIVAGGLHMQQQQQQQQQQHQQHIGAGGLINDLERSAANNQRPAAVANHYTPITARANGRVPSGSSGNHIGGDGMAAAVVMDSRPYYPTAFAPVLRQGPAAAAVVGDMADTMPPRAATMTRSYVVDAAADSASIHRPPMTYYAAMAASGRDLSGIGLDMVDNQYMMTYQQQQAGADYNGSAIVCRGSPIGSAVYRRSMDSLLMPPLSDHMSVCGGMAGDIGRRTTPV